MERSGLLEGNHLVLESLERVTEKIDEVAQVKTPSLDPGVEKHLAALSEAIAAVATGQEDGRADAQTLSRQVDNLRDLLANQATSRALDQMETELEDSQRDNGQLAAALHASKIQHAEQRQHSQRPGGSSGQAAAGKEDRETYDDLPPAIRPPKRDEKDEKKEMVSRGVQTIFMRRNTVLKDYVKQ